MVNSVCFCLWLIWLRRVRTSTEYLDWDRSEDGDDVDDDEGVGDEDGDEDVGDHGDVIAAAAWQNGLDTPPCVGATSCSSE